MKATRAAAFGGNKSLGYLLGAALAFLLAVGLAPAQPAQAHEELVGTLPEPGSTVAAGITEISVELSAEILLENAGSAIEVLDPSGASLIGPDCIAVDRATLYALVDLDQEGEYSVNWRSVSQDGHPIDGTFKFSVSNPDGYVASEARCQLEPGLVIAPAPSGSADDISTGSDGDANLTGLYIGLGLVVVGSLLAPLGIWLRRRGNERARSDEPDA